MRIVLAYDGSPSAEEAVERVLRRAGQRLVVRIVGVVDVRTPWWAGIAFSPHELTEALEASAAETRERIETATRDVALRLSDADIPCHVVIVEGPVEREIVKAAEDWSADYIAMGAGHQRTRFGRSSLGPVARRVARHAGCPVLIAGSQPH